MAPMAIILTERHPVGTPAVERIAVAGCLMQRVDHRTQFGSRGTGEIRQLVIDTNCQKKAYRGSR